MFWRKKPKIDKIENVTVLLRKYSYLQHHPNKRGTFTVTYSPNDVLEFSICANEKLSNIAKNELKNIIQELILAINERFYSDCNWLLRVDKDGMKEDEFLNLNKPFISSATTEDDSTFVFLNYMNMDVFNIIDSLDLAFFGMCWFTAYYPQNISNLSDIVGIFDNKKVNLDISSSTCGKYSPTISITYDPGKGNNIRQCIIDVFEPHGIKLDFITEDIT